MKFWTRKVGPDTPGRILVFKEKHGTRYFLAETEEQVHKVSLKILKEREWLGTEPTAPKLREAYEGMIFEPSSPLALTQQMIKDENDRCIAWYKDELHNYRLYKIAVENDNGPAAWTLLLDRSDCEYEEFSFEYVEKVDESNTV